MHSVYRPLTSQNGCLKQLLNLAFLHDGFEQTAWEGKPQRNQGKTSEAVHLQAQVFIQDAHQLDDHEKHQGQQHGYRSRHRAFTHIG